MKYRPWGPIDWSLSLSSKKQWHFVGSIGTEERSLCAWSYLKRNDLFVSDMLFEVQDVDSEKYRERIRIALEARRNQLKLDGGNAEKIITIELMAESFRISEVAKTAVGGGESVILDITSIPKRFFFPMLRELVTSNGVRDLVVTYTSPADYANDAPLYEDIEPWRVLPGFGGGRTRPDIWIVSVGFLVESLRQYVGDNPQDKMKVLVPFPAPLAVLRRTWESIANLEHGHSSDRFDKHRVETLDLSAAFDRIYSLASNPARHVAFAPFGPKPTSAAMCLYAIQRNSSVHYPQPTVYHPDYSKGIRNNDPATAISAYWIKHQGEFLYSL
jgi:hypothetical protein